MQISSAIVPLHMVRVKSEEAIRQVEAESSCLFDSLCCNVTVILCGNWKPVTSGNNHLAGRFKLCQAFLCRERCVVTGEGVWASAVGTSPTPISNNKCRIETDANADPQWGHCFADGIYHIDLQVASSHIRRYHETIRLRSHISSDLPLACTVEIRLTSHGTPGTQPQGGRI